MSLLFDNFDFMGVSENLDSVEIPVEEHMSSVGLDDNPYIVCEFAERMYKAEAAFYMVDAMLEHRVLAGEDVSALVENAVTDRIEKAIKWIKEFAGKVLAWFKKQIEQIAMLASSGATLHSKYGSKLKEKAKKVAKDFEYDIPDYNFDELLSMEKSRTYKTQLAASRERINTLKKCVDSAKKADKDSKDLVSAVSSADEVDTVKIREEIIDSAKNGSKRIGGSGEIANKVGDYLKYVGYYKEALASVKKAEKEFEKNAKSVIKEMEKLEKGMDKENNAKYVNYCVSMSRNVLTTQNATYSALINVSKEAYRDVFGVLRKLITFKEPKKGTKESFDNEESLFEAAYNAIGF